MKSIIENFADISSIAIPVTAGINELLKGDYTSTSLFAITAIVNNIAIRKIKRLFPLCIRPNGKKWSFPSGHTAAAWGGMVFYVAQEGVTTKSISLLVVTLLTTFSRWYTDHHHLTDLVAGASIGSFFGLSAHFLTVIYKRKKCSPSY